MIPPPRLTVAQWADRERYLSPEASAEPGKWHNDRAPHTVLPMECLSPKDPCEVVICKFSSQSSKTEILNNFAGYIAAQDPGPTLVVQPNQKPMGEAWSKDRLAPMIRDTPALKDVFAPSKGRESANTMMHKTFPGGHITIGGANSPAGLASRPIRYLLADEINRWEKTKEGDALKLATKRTLTFWNRKILLTSSPTYEDVGIDFEYKRSLQHEWHLQCQHCDEYQMPKFKHFSFGRTPKEGAVDIQYTCDSCGATHDNKTEHALKKSGKWVVVNESNAKRKGFWFNQFASPFALWKTTIDEFLDSKDDPEKLQTVVNTAFAENWQGAGEQIDWEALRARRVVYPQSKSGNYVPAGVEQLLLLVDTQDAYFDYEVIGVNRNLQSWGIEKNQLYGQTDQADVYKQLDRLLENKYTQEDGTELSIYATGIDIKGHRQKIVKDWLQKRKSRRVYGMAGMGQGARRQITRVRDKLDDGTKKKVDVYNIRVDDFKRIAQDYMGRTDPEDYGVCFWPKSPDGSDCAGYDEEVFRQLCAEKQETKISKGVASVDFIKTRPRNEAFDLRHMLYSLINIAKPPFSKKPSTQPTKIESPAVDKTQWVHKKNNRDSRAKSGGWMRR